MSAIWGIVNFKHSVNESDADTLKSQKVDFYMSNVMSENTLKRNEDININELLPVINQLTIPPIDNTGSI